MTTTTADIIDAETVPEIELEASGSVMAGIIETINDAARLDHAAMHVCELCARKFRTERALLSHPCEIRRRLDSRSDPIAAMAHRIYADFHARTRRSPDPNKKKTWDEFARSDTYSQFVRFAKFCIDSRVPNTEQYLKWILERNTRPHKWTDDDAFREFMLDYGMAEEPANALQRTVDFMVEKSKERGFKPKDFFRAPSDADLSYWAWCGWVSPWIMLNCDSGRERVANIMGAGDSVPRDRLLAVLNPHYWGRRFEEHSGFVAEITRYLREMGM